MTISSLIVFLLIGLLAGWLAGMIMHVNGQGLVPYLIIGCIGAFVGRFVFNVVGLHAFGILGELICDTIGAILFILLIRLLNKRVKL